MGLKPENVPQLTLNNGMKIPCIGLGTFGSDRVSAADVANAVGGYPGQICRYASVLGSRDSG